MAGAGTAVNGLRATTVIAGTADTPLTGINVRQKIGVNTMDITEAVSILMPYKTTTFGDSRSGGQISVAEIIELLRVKEPRIMTFSELNHLHRDDVIWLEDIDKAKVIPAIVCWAPEYSSIADTVELCAYYRDRYIRVSTKDYLSRWRCWTSRPTDAQREAEAWS